MAARKYYILNLVFLVLIFIGIFFSCTKDELRHVAKVETKAVSEIMATSARATGEIIGLGTGIDDHGHCWGFTSNPTINDFKTSLGTAVKTSVFTSELKNLEPGKSYHVRAYVISGEDLLYGTDITFTTLSAQITDIDGNVYNIVTIGTQVWMAENLKTTKYNDGTAIPNVTDNTAWANLATPAYCWYNNDEAANKAVYGALYNWYTVNTGKLCPTGWHVPTDAEWTTLTTFLGGEHVAGGKLKEPGTTHWLAPNSGATNETGFTALPAGARDMHGTYSVIGEEGYWWCSTEHSTPSAWNRDMGCGYAGVGRANNHRIHGSSVRCVRDF